MKRLKTLRCNHCGLVQNTYEKIDEVCCSRCLKRYYFSVLWVDTTNKESSVSQNDDEI